MGTWREYIESLKNEYIGKRVMWNNKPHTIVDVDINGCIHIDLPSKYNPTTAVFMPHDADKAIITSEVSHEDKPETIQ